jgi:GDPmannose 4,6-dehydratase
MDNGPETAGGWSVEMTAARRVIVTGAAGQDGFYLTERLLEEGNAVHALVRSASAAAALRAAGKGRRLQVHVFDLREADRMTALLREAKPDEIYNLAGPSSVGASFDRPSEAWQSNADAVVALLDAMRLTAPEAVLYQASSSEMYGLADGAEVRVTEESRLAPVSPYGAAKAAAHVACGAYRSGFGLRVACGILFNHESRRRGPGFLTRKIADYVGEASRLTESRRADGEALRVGNLAARRDWGFAPEYVDGIIRIARQMEHRATAAATAAGGDLQYRDYVLATGTARSVWELIDCAFALAGLPVVWDRRSPDPFDWTARYEDLGSLAVVSDPALRRATDPGTIVGDASRAELDLGWVPSRDPAAFMSDLLSGAAGQ